MDTSIDDYCNEEISMPQSESEAHISNETLIEAIHSRPSIWNMSDELYRNRVIKIRLWEDISKELDIEVTPKNISKIKKRWDQIRSSYIRLCKTPASGSGAVSMKPHRYERLLSFLDDTTIPRRSKSLCNDDESSHLDESAGIDDTPRSSTEEKSQLRKRPLTEYQQEKLSAKNRCIELLTTSVPVQKSANQVFGELISLELDKMSEEVQNQKKSLLLTILYQK